MTNEQKYSEVLKELGALLADKNATISCQKWQIDDLKKKLEKAEQELQEKQECCSVLIDKLNAANHEIDVLKGGAA
jgi:chromosome segregation ATPase